MEFSNLKIFSSVIVSSRRNNDLFLNKYCQRVGLPTLFKNIEIGTHEVGGRGKIRQLIDKINTLQRMIDKHEVAVEYLSANIEICDDDDYMLNMYLKQKLDHEVKLLEFNFNKKMALRQLSFYQRQRKAINIALYNLVKNLPHPDILISSLDLTWMWRKDPVYISKFINRYKTLFTIFEIKNERKLNRFISNNYFECLYINDNSKNVKLINWDHVCDIPIKKQNKRPRVNSGNVFIGPLNENSENISRSKVLLDKIHKLLDIFKNFRFGLYNVPYRFANCNPYTVYRQTVVDHSVEEAREAIEMEVFFKEQFEHQMESLSSHGEGEVVTDKKSNVILTEARNDGTESTAEQSIDWSEFCSSELSSEFSNVTDRWICTSIFEWNTDSDNIIKAFNFPYDAIVNDRNTSSCAVPNFAPFTFHRYWKGDMEVKIQVNSNKFQVGSLQCSWLYETDYDDKLPLRMNKYSLSQAPHVLVNASASNEVTMYIPYKNHLPLIHTKDRKDMPQCLHAGTLFITVLNKLITADGGPSKCYVSIFIRFINSVFTGMLDASIDSIEKFEHQMDRAILHGIADIVLNTLHPDSNRDNPPDPSPPAYLVPTASHSWSAGTGISEPLHSIRLDARGQTPHPRGIDANSEMSIKEICSKFGLIKTIIWDQDHNSGDILFDCDASPLLEKNQYFRVDPQSPQQVPYFMVPPVGVVSSMFMGWRGTMEFRFDVVCSSFHTGRLIAAYVPGAIRNSNVTVNKMRSSSNVIFTLQESQQFTFKVPFICNKPYWYRTQSGDYSPEDALAPSRIYLGVVNKLIPMQSVPPKVYINIYMRAGSDFEVIVPVQPALGLSFNNNFVAASDKPTIIVALPTYENYYSGSFEDLTFAQVFRWGQLAHEIAKFTGQNYYDSSTNQVSYCVLKDITAAPVYHDGKGTAFRVYYAIFIYLEQLKYIIGIPCLSEAKAQLAACNIFKLKKDVNSSLNDPFFLNNAWSTASNTSCRGNPQWEVRTWTCPTTIYEHQGERDQATNVLDVGAVKSTNDGLLLYGERFFSLKDLCRRYQYYGCYSLPMMDAKDTERVRFSFPILPQGLDLQIKMTSTNVNQLLNRCRDGIIPLVASGYRYYRGGIRFRMLFDPKVNVGVGIQHRPDKKLKVARIYAQEPTISGSTIMNHGYGTYIQLTAVNGIVEFEIPFYLFGTYGMLQRPKLSKTDEMNYFSMGEISVNIFADMNEIKNLVGSMVSIFYCLADDMHFSTFQGFPPVNFCNSIPPDNLGDSNVMWDREDTEILDHQMFNWLGNRMVAAVKPEIEARIRETTSHSLGEVRTVIEKFGKNNTNLYTLIGVDLLHMVAEGCSIKSVIFTIVKILLEMKALIIDDIVKFTSMLCDSVLKWLRSSSPEVISEESAVPEVLDHQMLISSFDPKIWIPLLGMFYVGTTAAVNIGSPPPPHMTKISSIFMRDIPSSLRGGSFFMSFLTNCITIVQTFVKWIVSKVYPVESWYYTINENELTVKTWCDEVFYLESLNLEEQLSRDPTICDRITYAYLTGRKLLLSTLDVRSNDAQLILKIIDKSIKLHEKCQALGAYPFMRREPFSVWMYGMPGIGKSFITEYITSHMLRAINYNLKGPKMFTIMPLGEFWTGCKNQPVLNMDDAFSVKTPAAMEKDLNIIYMVKSPVALNPPMANLEDKNLRYNPEIFWINSNHAVPHGNFYEEAIRRRSDIRIKAEVRDPSKPRANDYPIEVRRNYHHLWFYVANRADAENPVWGERMSVEQLIEYLCPVFREFHLTEIDNFHNRLETNTIIENRIMSQDEILHMISLEQAVSHSYEEKVAQYRRDVENCLYSKARGWVGSLYSDTIDSLLNRIRNIFGHQNGEIKLNNACCEEYLRILDSANVNVLSHPCKSLEFLDRLKVSNEVSTLWVFVQTDDYRVQYPKAYKALERIIMCDNVELNQAIFKSSVLTYKFNHRAWINQDLISYQDYIADVDNVRRIKLVQPAINILGSNAKDYEAKGVYAEFFLRYGIMPDERTGRLLCPLNEFEFNQLERLALRLSLMHPHVEHTTIIRICNFLKTRTVLHSTYLLYELKDIPSQLNEYFCIREWEVFLMAILYSKPDMLTDKFLHVVDLHMKDCNYIYTSENGKQFFKDVAQLIINSAASFTGEVHPFSIYKLYFIKYRDRYSMCGHLSCGDYDMKSACFGSVSDDFCNKIDPQFCIYSDRAYYNLFLDFKVLVDPILRLNLSQAKFENLPQTIRPRKLIQIKERIKIFLTSLAEKIKNFFSSASLKFCIKILTLMAGIGAFVATIIGAIYSFKLLSSSVKETQSFEQPSMNVLEEQCDSGDQRHEGAYAIPKHVIQAPKAPVYHLQSRQNITANLNRLNRNYCTITAKVNDLVLGTTRSVKARFLGICANAVLGIKHYHEEFMSLPLDTVFTVQLFGVPPSCSNMLEIRYRECKIRNYDLKKEGYDSSYYILYLPPSVPLFPNIVNMFAPHKSLQYISRECDLFEFGTALHSGLPVSVKRDLPIRGKGAQQPVRLDYCITYAKSGPGMCGSVLLDSRFEAPIIAMHVAGGATLGIADILYREMFTGLLDKLIVKDVEQPPVDEPAVMEKIITGETNYRTKGMVELEACMMKYGTVNSQMAHRETGKTQLRPSLIQGVFPINTAPNPLSVNDPRLPKDSSPMKLGCEKHGLPVLDFPEQHMEAVKRDVLEMLKTKCKPVRQYLSALTLEEAVCGETSVPHFESLEWNTSPGFGFTHLRPKNASGKRWLFDLEETENGYKLKGMHERLIEVMLEKHKKRENGIVPCTIYVDCLKDTTLPIEKCKTPGKTRIFSISPVDFTIQFKQFFGDFLAAYTSSRFEVESAIGINVLSPEWSDLTNRLFKMGSNIVSGDYSNFGPGLSMSVACMALDIIIEWYKFHGVKESHLQIMNIMKYEVLNCHHLCFNLLYQTFCGISSGSPITTPLNNLVNCCYLRLAWCEIFKGTLYEPLINFKQHVTAICYGDDVIMSVNDSVISKFNCETLHFFFKKYKIKFTNCDKSDNIIKFQSINEVSFLSGFFIPHPTRDFNWLYGLKKESIEGCVNWVRTKNQSVRVATLVNADMALRYAYGWGEQYYEYVGQKLQSALSQHKIDFVYKRWEDQDRLIFELEQDIFVESIFLDFD